MQAYLEQQIEEYERTEQERIEDRQMATRKILERMKQDDALRSFEGSMAFILLPGTIVCITVVIFQYLTDTYILCGHTKF